MLNQHQIANLAAAQAQFLAYALSLAHSSLEILPSVRRDSEAKNLLEALELQLLSAERGYETLFAKRKGFVDTRMGETPVDLMNRLVSRGHEDDPLFVTVCQWVMAQRLRTRLLYEATITPVHLVALSRFCVAVREEAKRSIQQSRGEAAAMLAAQLDQFEALISSYQGRAISVGATHD